MVLAVWKDSYATGYHKIDNQHKELFGMINELHKSILAGKDKDIHLDILNQLSRYIVNHFSLEESIMLIMNYPSYDEHKRKHEALAKETMEIIVKYETGTNLLSLTLSDFLSKWLRHHIKEDDMALFKFIKERHPEKLKVVEI